MIISPKLDEGSGSVKNESFNRSKFKNIPLPKVERLFIRNCESKPIYSNILILIVRFWGTKKAIKYYIDDISTLFGSFVSMVAKFSSYLATLILTDGYWILFNWILDIGFATVNLNNKRVFLVKWSSLWFLLWRTVFKIQVEKKEQIRL